MAAHKMTLVSLLSRKLPTSVIATKHASMQANIKLVLCNTGGELITWRSDDWVLLVHYVKEIKSDNL
jgi:hypothetical protein